jgi:hypothetical protein
MAIVIIPNLAGMFNENQTFLIKNFILILNVGDKGPVRK